MTLSCAVYIATSLDGFIARPDGDIDWLMRPEYATEAMEGLSYDEFMSTVDTLVMGRHSFEKVLTFDEWPYAVPVVVLSSRSVAVPDALHGRVRVMNLTPPALVAKLAGEGKKKLYIDGGQTIQRFLRAGLIDELTITILPLILGDGLPLFGVVGHEIALRLLAATPSPNGFVQVRYAIE
ncbi:MAG: dihydrofolate reductase [Anaerolineales bacterium]|nr:dihydrofolate reductase [Anaerolineales bacterium]